MANLLFLVHRMPYPPDKGDKVRSYHLLKHLGENNRVFVGTFVDDPADLAHLEALRAMCADLLVLLSDVDGLYDSDPHRPGARLVAEVRGPGDLDGVRVGGADPSRRSRRSGRGRADSAGRMGAGPGILVRRASVPLVGASDGPRCQCATLRATLENRTV